MKKLIVLTFCLLLITGVTACINTQPTNNQAQSTNSTAAKDIAQEYDQFIKQYDTSQLTQLQPDVTKPDQIQEEYNLITNYLTKAEQIQSKMSLILTNSNEKDTKILLSTYMDTLNARIAVLKANKATYLRMGAQ
ncbi:MAG: hypothetical protein AB7V50_04010 [Vampirovibrionia bacterium]